MADIPPFSDILREHAPYVWRALRYLGVPERDLEDGCQEVFMVVHRKIAGFKGRSTIRTWLYGISLRVAAGYRRSARQRHEMLLPSVPEVSIRPPQEDRAERRLAHDRLVRLLALLDDDKREVFVLFEVEQFTIREVAQLVGCPLQTAYSRLHAAREILQEAVHRSAERRVV
jgi:RNA polymerase sigma-70 factor (ECF subfamily)